MHVGMLWWKLEEKLGGNWDFLRGMENKYKREYTLFYWETATRNTLMICRKLRVFLRFLRYSSQFIDMFKKDAIGKQLPAIVQKHLYVTGKVCWNSNPSFHVTESHTANSWVPAKWNFFLTYSTKLRSWLYYILMNTVACYLYCLCFTKRKRNSKLNWKYTSFRCQ